MEKALVYKSTGSWYLCRMEDGCFEQARVRGKFKADKSITSTNPIAVGDEVILRKETDTGGHWIIQEILPRKNYLVRESPQNRRQQHIVASNLDQSLIVATIREPKTSTGFIDRFLISCEAFHIPAILVFNKLDLLDSQERNYLDDITKVYERAGYQVIHVSALNNQGIDALQKILNQKITLFTGHSGVGKSTLINKLIPVKDIRVQEVSGWSGKGMHTTTFAEMHDMPEGGAIIDTPGIRELGIMHVTKAELGGYFPEIRQISSQCKYNNCMHENEPQCAVIKAVAEGLLPEFRYIGYRKILETVSDRKY